MTPPRRLLVSVHTYAIVWDESGLVGRHADNRGSTDKDELLIALDARLPASRQRETLLHEVLHAAWGSTSLRSTGAHEHEEVVVDALAPVLLDALRRNPALVAFLLANR